jgi:hypothetical protein
VASIEKFPVPDNVEHLDRVSRVDALAAEAVRDYESAAKEIEAMGTELISAAKKFEAMTTDVGHTIRDTAEAYRAQGKKISERIEQCVSFTEHVRKTCEDLKRRIETNSGAQ